MKLFSLEKSTIIDKENSYIYSYPAMISFFKNKDILTTNDVIVGIHMVYGWMPTILAIKGIHNIEKATNILNKLKHYNKDTVIWKIDNIEEDLELLKLIFNNSIVGVSKFLHFMKPELYPIYDSKIYRYIKEEEPYNYRVNDVSSYLMAIKTIEAVSKDKRAGDFHKSVQNKVGYPISKIRAIELIMFLNSSN